MELPKEKTGTRKDLVFYRLQTAKADLKSVMRAIMMISILPAGKKQRGRLLWQMNLYRWLKSTV